MAEFVRTMKDWYRMCQFMDKEYGNSSCDNCPLGGCSAVYEMCGKESFTNMERDISAWAAEHPVIYPTWREWFIETGMWTHGLITDAVINKPIPADMAQKLEIAPKEC